MIKKLTLGVIFLITAASFAYANDARVRKNIDDLTTTELGNYLHAMEILQSRDPGATNSYNFYAAVHNTSSVGPCEHHRDTFMPWHRAHLLAFETELRGSDPPRTSDVTIPYWNWSVPPSGSRYPKIFEDTSVAALQPPSQFTRATGKICQEGETDGCQPVMFPWSSSSGNPATIEKSLAQPDWDSFASHSNEAIKCEDRAATGQVGQPFESPIHDSMHTSYIRGAMTSTGTAASDPIFWSFHAFFDLVFAQWQEGKDAANITCQECELCFTYWDSHGEPVRKVSEYTDPSKQGPDSIDVSYDFTPPTTLVAIDAAITTARIPLLTAHVAWCATGTPITEKVLHITIPDKPIESAVIKIPGVATHSNESFQINGYLYPEDDVDWEPQSLEFRKNHMIYFSSLWGMDHGESSHSEHLANLRDTFDSELAHEINHLVSDHADEKWTLKILVIKDPEHLALENTGNLAASSLSGDHVQQGDISVEIK